MASYGQNILPTDAAYYTLNNATISDGVLTLQASGSATYDVSDSSLTALMEWFRVSMVASTSHYNPTLFMRLSAATVDGNVYNYTCTPTRFADEVYTVELKMEAAEYAYFYVTIYATQPATVTLWELCPQVEGDIETIIEGVKQSLPRLLADYNTTGISVGQSEQIIAMINCNLSSDTGLQGHFLMNFVASERCNVHLRFYNNEVTELFSPNVNVVEAGYNTIEVPHAYLKALKGDHNIYVTAQCTNGTLSVPIRGVLFTIDGGYLATRLSDPAMDIQDLTVKQLSEDYEPSEVWAVGVDNNKVIVKKRKYDPDVANEGWDFVVDLGEGKSGAIEFDGIFVMRADEPRYTLETTEVPYVAVIDMDNNLVCYMGDFEEDPVSIATNVSQCSMVRGYKSVTYPDQDQGVILAWLSNGNVYYKQYAYYSGQYIWLPTETLVSTGTATFVQVHRLNDYRVGIVVQDSTLQTTTWYITSRTYVNQAVPGEVFYTGPQGYAGFIMMTPAEVSSISHVVTQNDLSDVSSAQDTFTLTWAAFDHIKSIDGMSSWQYYITVIVNGEEVYSDAYTVSIIGNTLRVILKEAVWGSVRVTIPNFNDILLCFSDDRGIACETSGGNFNWVVSRTYRGNEFETLPAAMSGSLTFSIVPIVPLTASYNETVATPMSGSMTFTDVLITYSDVGYSETVNSLMSGSLVFTDVLVGEEPI